MKKRKEYVIMRRNQYSVVIDTDVHIYKIIVSGLSIVS